MTIEDPLSYWNPLWESGRRYRSLVPEETGRISELLGAGRNRPALDIGCGDGSLARRLHHELGFRTTGIDCSPAALASAETAQDAIAGPRFQRLDFEADDLGALPDPAYVLITCRLVYAFIKDKGAFLDRVRHLLAPGGVAWIATPMAGRLPAERRSIGITEEDEALLTAGWSTVRSDDQDTIRCYTLRP
ncbi:class I SAM-dependent methyltransferase [Streptomyces sp. NPDC058251]|uniref:class I SAM-dependent methyltransferase n=1 Tax=Streptomyces sp. NPDC058251 TaxID=3346404 RepID=UPI0036E3E37D